MSDYTPAPTDGYTPKVPNRVRDWSYAIGILLGVGAAPALLALGYDALAGVAAAMSGAANALAFGYRPGRKTGDPE